MEKEQKKPYSDLRTGKCLTVKDWKNLMGTAYQKGRKDWIRIKVVEVKANAAYCSELQKKAQQKKIHWLQAEPRQI